MYEYKTQNHGNYIIVTILHKKHCSYTSSSAFSGRSSSVGKYSVNSARTGALVVYDHRIEGLRQDVRPNTSIVHPYKNGPCQIYTLIDIKNKLKAILEQFFSLSFEINHIHSWVLQRRSFFFSACLQLITKFIYLRAKPSSIFNPRHAKHSMSLTVLSLCMEHSCLTVDYTVVPVISFTTPNQNKVRSDLSWRTLHSLRDLGIACKSAQVT